MDKDTILELIGVDPTTKWVIRVIAISFSALCIWMWLFRDGLPDGLKEMTAGAWGMVCATAERSKSAVEKLIHKDLDGDGKIGDETAAQVTAVSTVVAAPVVAPTQSEVGPI